jgi:hypothetical protein
VNVQTAVLPDSAAPKIAQSLAKGIKDHADKGDFELVTQPKTEPDDRFFLRLHHKFKKGELVGDEIQIIRVIGLDLVTVAATAFTDNPDEAKQVFDDAAKTLMSVKTAKQAAMSTPTHGAVSKARPATHPTALPQAKIVFNGPGGWSEETNDNTTGIVATYHDPVEQFNTIVISVRPLPPEAKKDPKIRDALVEEIVNGEKTSFKFDGANVVGETETVKDNRFLKKVRIRYEKADSKIQVTSRIRRVGDAVVSVAMASVEANANDVDKLADDVAMTLRPAPGAH